MRKMHYNEGLNIKLARQLIANELEEDDDEDEEMRDDSEELTEETEISVDPPQEGKEGYTLFLCTPYEWCWQAQWRAGTSVYESTACLGKMS